MNNEYNINTSGASNNNNANNAYAFLPDNAQKGEPVSGVGSAEKRKAMHWERTTRQAERLANLAADDVGRKTRTSMHGGTF
ncbi:MAG: hypothetical protein IJT83_11605 [Victivallales bacterium]|nr:hypothetical protein [Victivallales bacterium]